VPISPKVLNAEPCAAHHFNGKCVENISSAFSFGVMRTSIAATRIWLPGETKPTT